MNKKQKRRRGPSIQYFPGVYFPISRITILRITEDSCLFEYIGKTYEIKGKQYHKAKSLLARAKTDIKS